MSHTPNNPNGNNRGARKTHRRAMDGRRKTRRHNARLRGNRLYAARLRILRA